MNYPHRIANQNILKGIFLWNWIYWNDITISRYVSLIIICNLYYGSYLFSILLNPYHFIHLGSTDSFSQTADKPFLHMTSVRLLGRLRWLVGLRPIARRVLKKLKLLTHRTLSWFFKEKNTVNKRWVLHTRRQETVSINYNNALLQSRGRQADNKRSNVCVKHNPSRVFFCPLTL